MPLISEQNLHLETGEIGIAPFEDKETFILVTVGLDVLFWVVHVLNNSQNGIDVPLWIIVVVRENVSRSRSRRMLDQLLGTPCLNP
jgi:hypothetical protein